MRQVCVVVTIMFGLLLSSWAALAQSVQTDSSAVPRVMNVTGVFRPADGQPPAPLKPSRCESMLTRWAGRRCGKKRSGHPRRTRPLHVVLGSREPRAFHPQCWRPARSG